MQKSERKTFMAAQSDSSFDLQSKTTFQSPGLMENFSTRRGLVSASSSKTVKDSSMVGSEATIDGVDRANVSSKIGEIGEIFPVGSEAITVEVGVTSVSSWIKTGERFSMRSYFQKLNRNFHFPRVSPGNVERVGSLE